MYILYFMCIINYLQKMRYTLLSLFFERDRDRECVCVPVKMVK